MREKKKKKRSPRRRLPFLIAFLFLNMFVALGAFVYFTNRQLNSTEVSYLAPSLREMTIEAYVLADRIRATEIAPQSFMGQENDNFVRNQLGLDADEDVMSAVSPGGTLILSITCAEHVQDRNPCSSSAQVDLWDIEGEIQIPIDIDIEYPIHSFEYGVNSSQWAVGVCVSHDQNNRSLCKYEGVFGENLGYPRSIYALYHDQERVEHLTFSPNGEMLATVSTANFVHLWNSETNHITMLRIDADVDDVAFTSDGHTLRVYFEGDIVKEWDIRQYLDS